MTYVLKMHSLKHQMHTILQVKKVNVVSEVKTWCLKVAFLVYY